MMLVGLMLAVSGCASQIADIPLPGTGTTGDTFRMSVVFSSVLNLPDRAKVMLDGVRVGTLRGTRIVGNDVAADIDMSTDVQLPTTTKAELRQTTVLGEIFIALSRPDSVPADTPLLRGGDVIPLAQTTPATNVEDLLRSLANLTQGGRLPEVAAAIRQINANFPSAAEVRSLAAYVRTTLGEINRNTDDLDAILDSTRRIAGTLADQSTRLSEALRVGPDRSAGLGSLLNLVTDLVYSLGSTADGLRVTFAPYVGSFDTVISQLAPALKTFATEDLTTPVLTRRTQQLLRDKLIPYFARLPQTEIVGVGPAAQDPNRRADPGRQADQLVGVLRGLGMVR